MINEIVDQLGKDNEDALLKYGDIKHAWYKSEYADGYTDGIEHAIGVIARIAGEKAEEVIEKAVKFEDELIDFCKYLEAHGYLDDDWRNEGDVTTEYMASRIITNGWHVILPPKEGE